MCLDHLTGIDRWELSPLPPFYYSDDLGLEKLCMLARKNSFSIVPLHVLVRELCALIEKGSDGEEM